MQALVGDCTGNGYAGGTRGGVKMDGRYGMVVENKFKTPIDAGAGAMLLGGGEDTFAVNEVGGVEVLF